MALEWKKLALLQYALNPSGDPQALGLDAEGDLRVVDDEAQALLQRVVDALGEDSGSTVNSLLTVLSQVDFATSANQDTAQAVYDRIIETLGEASGASVLAVLQSIDTELATQQKDALTDAELRASDVGVEVGNFLLPSTVLTTTDISGANWSGDTYTSDWEQALFPYFGCVLQTDEDGTLFFDFSLDGGATFSSYPVNGVSVASGINEVHTAYKGSRSLRIRFVGTGGRTYFRLLTDYSPSPLPLSAPVNQQLTADQDATPVRAFGAGLDPDGNVINVDAPGFYSEQASNTPRAIGTPFEPSTWSAVNGYGSHQFVIFSNAPLDETYYTDAAGEQGSVLIEVSEDGVNKLTDFIIETGFAAPSEFAIFTFGFPFFRIKVAPPLSMETFFLTNVIAYTGPPTPPIRSIDSDFTGRGLALTSRTVLFGRQEGAVTTDPMRAAILSANGNLIVALGDRISQTGGRSHNEVNTLNVSASGSLYTVPANFAFHVTSIEWAGASTSTSAPVRARLRDGGAAGELKYSFAINEPTAFAQQAGNGGQTYPEPTLFETDIYFELVTGAFTGDILVVGYLEPV